MKLNRDYNNKKKVMENLNTRENILNKRGENGAEPNRRTQINVYYPECVTAVVGSAVSVSVVFLQS